MSMQVKLHLSNVQISTGRETEKLISLKDARRKSSGRKQVAISRIKSDSGSICSASWSWPCFKEVTSYLASHSAHAHTRSALLFAHEWWVQITTLRSCGLPGPSSVTSATEAILRFMVIEIGSSI